MKKNIKVLYRLWSIQSYKLYPLTLFYQLYLIVAVFQNKANYLRTNPYDTPAWHILLIDFL